NEAITAVELEWWMPNRRRLLDQVLQGLRATRLKSVVQSALHTWFPNNWHARNGLYTAMAHWPKLPEVSSALWRGVHDENPGNQRAAGQALAVWGRGDTDIGDRVASLAYGALEPETRAVAIESLLLGWPSHRRVVEIFEAVRSSLSPELRLAS